MKKTSKLLLLIVVALGLGFTACESDDIANNAIEEGNTHVSVTLRLSSNGSASTRALPNDYNDVGTWAGKDSVESLTVYLVDGASVNAKTFEVGTGKAYEQDTNGRLVPKTNEAAIRTTAGSKTVYVVINPTSEVTAHLNKTPVAEFDEAYQNIALVAANSGSNTTVSTSADKLAVVDSGNDKIVMTNVKPATINVEPNITVDQTLTGSPLNRVTLEVERAVARVMTTTAATSYNIPTTNAGGATSLGTISEITWVLAQGENSLYIQRKVDWSTPNFGWVPASQDNYVSNAADKYDYSGLFENNATGFGGTTIPTLAAYTSLNAAGDNKSAVLASLNLDENAVNGKFVLPTTHQFGENSASNYKKGNTAYVLVRAKFTPSDEAWADNGAKATDGTFYVGSNGKIYTSAQAAYDDTKSTTMTKYENGKVLYYAWVNPDNVPDWYNSPVIRNNIYHIHIKGFRNLGTNWNPLYPENPERELEDPNQPYDPIDNPYKDDKENPDPKPIPETVEDPNDPGTKIPVIEPENPITPEDPLTTPETWMSVDVTILPWLIHSYEIELGM